MSTPFASCYRGILIHLSNSSKSMRIPFREKINKLIWKYGKFNIVQSIIWCWCDIGFTNTNRFKFIRKYHSKYELWLIRSIRIFGGIFSIVLVSKNSFIAGIIALSLGIIWSEHIRDKRTDRMLQDLKEKTKDEYTEELHRKLSR